MWIACHRNTQYTYIVSMQMFTPALKGLIVYSCYFYSFTCTGVLSYYRKTKTVTSRTDISYSPPPGAPEFTPCSLHSSCCLILCFLCSVLYITVCPFISIPLAMVFSVFFQLPFGHDIVCLLYASLCPWSCLSFVSFPLAMLLSVFCQFSFDHDIFCLLSLHLWPWYCLSF